jgi:hypothetical protein
MNHLYGENYVPWLERGKQLRVRSKEGLESL